MNTPEQDREEYRAKCDHKRIAHRVYDINNNLVFDGSKDQKRKEVLGINAAKRYIRTNNLKSFTE